MISLELDRWEDMGMLKYVISQDKKSGVWYCHMQGYPNIPVFGSVGDKKQALKIMRERNNWK